MTRADYPLLLAPHLAERVWGGDRLGKSIGEAWDLSVHPNGPCRIRNGPLRDRTLAEVAEAFPGDFGGPIRLLGKRLDCKETLSVQVHPKLGDPKTETWVPLQIGRGAGVYHGFQRPVTREEVRRAAQDGSLKNLLRFVEARADRAIFVPSGTVHAIGAGLFLFELQQSADTTYRLFDWGRGRELHLEQSLDCMDVDPVEPMPLPRPRDARTTRLVECEFFRVDRVESLQPWRIEPGAAWTAMLLVEGEGLLGEERLSAGETAIVSRAAGARTFTPRGNARALFYGP